MLLPQIKLNGWQTIAAFARENKLTTQDVSHMILRAKANPEKAKILFLEYPELNNIKLVKLK